MTQIVDPHRVTTLRQIETTERSVLTPTAVGGLAFVTAVLTGFGVVVIGNDLGSVLADASADRSGMWRPLIVFLCLPISVIVAACSVATVTGSRHPASGMATAAVVVGAAIGSGVGRLVWRFIEVQTYGEVRGLLDGAAILLLVGSVLAAGVAGALIGDRFGSHRRAERVGQVANIVATALIAYPTMELIAGRQEIGSQKLWMLGFMLLALGLAPRIGLMTAEGEDSRTLQLDEFYDVHAQRDNSASVRLAIGFAAGWMASILVHTTQASFDGQLGRYMMAWILPIVLAAPGILAHLDRLTGRAPELEPAPIDSFNRS